MLKEHNYFSEELPISVTTARIDNYKRHFHDDVEVIYVMEGEVYVRSGYYEFKLVQGDIFIVNVWEIHSLEKTDKKNMVMMLTISTEYFLQYYDDLKNALFFVCGSKNEREYAPLLKEIMARIMIHLLKKGQGYEHKVIESTHNLISCMLKNFNTSGDNYDFLEEDLRFRGKCIVTARFRRIMNYIYENYRQKPTLNEIAESEHLSLYYLSHIIKEATGMSFQELLSFVRVDESTAMLIQTEKKLGQISKETGFSALRYYSKHFEQWFGCSPAEFREGGKSKLEELQNSNYVRCSPREISDAIRADIGINSVIAQSGYLRGKNADLHIVAVDMTKKNTLRSGNLNFVGDMMINENLKIIERPYSLFKSLNEEKLAEGGNYTISFAVDENTGITKAITILLYSINSDNKRNLILADNKEKIYELCSDFAAPSEFLIKLSGVSGNFSLTRCRLSKENIATAYLEAIKEKGAVGKREGLLSSWAALPNIEVDKIKVADTLSIRSVMYGISSELILIDRI